jgi:NAD(P)-dependent dehydrogenase (short-subunit alcohol dehydrogenase family)
MTMHTRPSAIEAAGRKAVLMPGDIQDATHCRKVIDKAVAELGGIDLLVNNAAHQASFKGIGELTFRVNIHCDVLPDQGRGAAHEAGQRHHQYGEHQLRHAKPDPAGLRDAQSCDPELHRCLVQLLAEKGIRANAVAPRADLDAADPIDVA